jgi:hypothetical protein
MSGVNANEVNSVRDTVMKVVEQVVASLETKHSATLAEKQVVLAEKDTMIQELINTLAEQDVKYLEVIRRINEATIDNAMNVTHIEELNECITKMKVAYDTLDSKYQLTAEWLSDASLECAKNKEVYESVSRRNNELLSEISSAKTDIVKLFNERNDLRLKCANYEQTIKTLQLNIDTIKREYAEELLSNCVEEPNNYYEYFCDRNIDKLIAYWSGHVQDFTISGAFQMKHSFTYCSMLADVMVTLNNASSESQVSKLSTLLSDILKNHPEYYNMDIGCGSNVYDWIVQQCNIKYSTKDQVDLIAQIINAYISIKRTNVFNNKYFGYGLTTNRVYDKYYHEYHQLFVTASKLNV